MKGYAQSQTYIPKIDDTYMGWAVFEDDNEINEDDIYGTVSKAIVPFTYILQPVVVFVVILCIIALIYVFTRPNFSNNIFEQPLKEICESNETQATFFALVLVSILITFYMFCVNIILLIKRDAKLSAYYPENGYGFSIPITSFVFSIISILMVFVAAGFWLYWKISGKCDFLCISSLALYFGSTIFQISFHIPSILMAWSTDPFYASKIGVYYAVYIFLNYTASKYTYILSLKLCKSCKYSILCTIFSVIFALLLINGVLITITIFVVNIPVNNSIEESADGIKSLYNSAVVLIGGIIAYNVGWYYFFGSFSFNKAMEKAMTNMKVPFSDNSHWQSLTEEERMAEVMKALISHQTLSRPLYDPLYSALTNVLIKACSNGKRINPPADQVVSLSAVLYNAITTAVRNAAENDDQKIKLTDALVQVMNKSTFVLDDPHIGLAKTPTDEKLTALSKKKLKADHNAIITALKEALTP